MLAALDFLVDAVDVFFVVGMLLFLLFGFLLLAGVLFLSTVSKSCFHFHLLAFGNRTKYLGVGRWPCLSFYLNSISIFLQNLIIGQYFLFSQAPEKKSHAGILKGDKQFFNTHLNSYLRWRAEVEEGLPSSNSWKPGRRRKKRNSLAQSLQLQEMLPSPPLSQGLPVHQKWQKKPLPSPWVEEGFFSS
uniref:Uncharacterized protein n=1 Tax=Cacopsylla melanoneura TaxID=428564 RepID=A0A8D8YG56_9HEMI